jgi:signal transduction histidine kinase/phage shock protein PspC (stress-responsive transcriptional regulator)
VDAARDRVARRFDRWRFRRSPSDRLLTGVAGGLAERWQVEPLLVRLAFVVLTLAGGAGAAAYGAAWLLSDEPAAAGADEARTATQRSPVRAVAFTCVTAGALLLLRSAGFWLGDALVIPAAVLALGTAVAWGGFGSGATATTTARRSPIDYVFAGGRLSAWRSLAGLVLVVAGLLALVGRGGTLDDLRRAASAVGLAVAGITLALGPVIGRLARQVADERRDRMRTEARAEIAAHLHDSVLQTLTLIQRAASDPARVLSLARRQERELRAWLYGDLDVLAPATTLSRAVDLVAAEVESVHAVRVEAVVVGDARLDARTEALVAAVREAVVNAAKHAKTDSIAVYIEVGPAQIEAFVRDRGIGFDPAQVPDDRQGLRGSVKGRMQGLGGRAEVSSRIGAGTEVMIVLPFQPSEPVRSGA